MDPAVAVAHTYMNRAEVEGSDVCGCYRCAAIFAPSAVRLWADSTDPKDDDPGALRDSSDKFPGYSAVCPFCEDTSVIGSASGAPITTEFLTQVLAYWSTR